VPDAGAVALDDLERRLLEMGFVEGARIELLHEGWMGRDPIAVRVDEATVALRRREASFVLVAGEAA
jgi:ferrous iron transport protein A